MDPKPLGAAALLLIALILAIVSMAIPEFAVSTTPPVTISTTKFGEQKMKWGVWKTCNEQGGDVQCTGGEPIYMLTSYPEFFPSIQASRAFYVIGCIVTVVALALAVVAALQKAVVGIPAGAASLAAFICFLIAWDCMVGMLNTRYKEIGPSVMEWKSAALTARISGSTARYIVATTSAYGLSFVLGIIAFVLPVPAMVLLCLTKANQFDKGPALMTEHM